MKACGEGGAAGTQGGTGKGAGATGTYQSLALKARWEGLKESYKMGTPLIEWREL